MCIYVIEPEPIWVQKLQCFKKKKQKNPQNYVMASLKREVPVLSPFIPRKSASQENAKLGFKIYCKKHKNLSAPEQILSAWI